MMKMTYFVFLFAVCLAYGAVSAEESYKAACTEHREPPPPRYQGRKGGGEHSLPSPRFGSWVGKCVLSPKFIREASISPSQVDSLRTAIGAISARQQALETNITSIAQKQLELGKKILETRGEDPAPLYALAEEIARLRGEQAKLSLQTLIAIRETLDDVQRNKVREILRAEAGQRRKERMLMRKNRENREKTPRP